jgi:redox-sensitive bicupin YhaK (pirin superfamily)
MAQLWVNLPRVHKLAPAGYQPILAEQIGVARLSDAAGAVRVIAGEFQGVRGPARTFTPINVYDARLASGGAVEFSFAARQTAALLVMEGEVVINGAAEARKHDFVVFRNAGERIAIRADSEAQLLVLNGERIDEPIVQYGPFVMNSEEEIERAILDFNSGNFGRLDA